VITSVGPVKLAPTVEAIDAWLALEKLNKPADAYYATEYDQYGVNIYTKASAARCITSRVVDQYGHVHYWTIRGEGSSNGCREYAIRADRIVRAEGWIVV
jgi:hypothetical protein